MRSRIGIAVAVLLAVSSVASADLVATAQLNDITVYPIYTSALDQTITLEVRLDASEPIMGAQMYLQSLDGAGIFNLTGVTFNTADGWGDQGFVGVGANQRDASSTLSPIDTMAGGTSELFGALATGSPVSGNTLFATLTLTLLGGTQAGTYDLNLSDLIVSNSTGDIEVMGDIGSPVTVEVLPIPAPPALWLAGMGLAFAARLRKRMMA